MSKIVAVIVVMFAIACSERPQVTDADKMEARQTAQRAKQAAVTVGPVGITSFTEKKHTKMLYEFRDKEVATFTYVIDLNGQLHFLCDSIGFGIPASVQYVNPERVAHENDYNGGSFGTLPQPEPNGLFMPEGLDATYVLCSAPDGKLHPVYSEPKLMVSPFKLRSVDSYAVE